MELEYKDLNPTAKMGINKFTKLSSKSMVKYGKMFQVKTGKNPYDVNLKNEFYSFVQRNNLRKKR